MRQVELIQHEKPSIAKLVERGTVDLHLMLLSPGHWFDSGSTEFLFFFNFQTATNAQKLVSLSIQ